MDLELKGKRALVTGSSSGIGEQVAQRLAEEGASVIVHGRNRERAEAVAARITDAGGSAAVAIGDLATDADASAVIDQAVNAFGGLDIVVNNAGVFNETDWDTSPDTWNDIYNTNVTSMVRVIQGTLPELKKNGWGRFVQIASGVGSAPFPSAPDYNATKAANINMTVSLAKTLAGTNVTANAVSPGPIKTPALEKFFRGFADQMGWGDDWDTIEAKAVEQFVPNPTGRVGRPEEIADTVAFLSSPRADYINGANIRVDGGFVPSVN
ncbi:MAG: SDR family NAD(P)-dependent oxidoreductase [Planctomycetota bacterium]